MSKGSSVIVRSNAVRSCSFAVVLAPSISDDTGGARMTPIIITQIIKTVGLTFFLRISHAHSKLEATAEDSDKFDQTAPE